MDLIKFCQTADKNIIAFIADFLDLLTLRSWLWTALILRGKGGKIWIDSSPGCAIQIGNNIRKFRLYFEKYPHKAEAYAWKMLHPGMIKYFSKQNSVSVIKGLSKGNHLEELDEYLAKHYKDEGLSNFWIAYTCDAHLIKKYLKVDISVPVRHEYSLMRAFCMRGRLDLLIFHNASFDKIMLKLAFKSGNYEVIMTIFRKIQKNINLSEYLIYAVKHKHLMKLLLTPYPIVYWHMQFKISKEELVKIGNIARKKKLDTWQIIKDAFDRM